MERILPSSTVQATEKLLIPTGADAGRWTGLMLWLQKMIGEPWLRSVHPENLGPFLEKSGWTNDPALAGETSKHGMEFLVVATNRT